MNLLVHKFKKLLRYEKQPQRLQHKNEERSLFVPTYFQCRKKCHIKANFLKIRNQLKDTKDLKEIKNAHITCDDDDMDSSDESEVDKEVKMSHDMKHTFQYHKLVNKTGYQI